LYKLLGFCLKNQNNQFLEHLVKSIDFLDDIKSTLNLLLKDSESTNNIDIFSAYDRYLHNLICYFSIFSVDISNTIEKFFIEKLQNSVITLNLGNKRIGKYSLNTNIKETLLTLTNVSPYCNHKLIFMELYKLDKKFALKNKNKFKDVEKYLAIL
jgi:hypothetical protein